jgi:hypothetical protein
MKYSEIGISELSNSEMIMIDGGREKSTAELLLDTAMCLTSLFGCFIVGVKDGYTGVDK